MLGNVLIGLREGLEASLVVSILVAYVVKTGRRHLLGPLWLGVGIAVAVSLGFGAVLTFGSAGLPEEAEEAIAGTLSILAVGLVTWMIFWMTSASATIAADLRSRVDAAARPWSLALIAALAVGREGLETAMFVWAATGAAAAGGGSATWPLTGALLGLGLSVALGWLLYRGVLRVNLRRFFAITGGFLVLVAAGVLAYGVHDLQEAGVLPGEDNHAFDISAIMSPQSLVGTLLRGVFNVTPAPTVLQFVVWVAYLVVVGALFIRRVRTPARTTLPAGPAKTRTA